MRCVRISDPIQHELLTLRAQQRAGLRNHRPGRKPGTFELLDKRSHRCVMPVAPIKQRDNRTGVNEDGTSH